MKKIYTGNYINFSNTDYNLISISGDSGAKEKYQGQYIRELLAEYIKLYTDIDIEISEGIIVNGNIKPIEHPKYVEDILKEEILLSKVKPELIIKPKIRHIMKGNII